MTTLPQTTPMRLPRPAGANQIAIPGAPLGSHASPTAGGIQMTGADVWRVFRSNWWLIGGMVFVAAVIGFFTNQYLKKNYPKFTAQGLIRVSLPEEYFRDKSEESSATPQSIELEQKTQARGLLQPGLILSVLRDSDKLRETDWFKSFKSNAEGAKEDLLDNLSVQPIASSRLIAVEMTYRNPDNARVILEEVVSRYIADEKAKNINNWDDQAANLRTRKETYEREYNRITNELTAKSSPLGVKDFYKLSGMQENQRYELSRLTDSRSTAQKEFTQAKNASATLEQIISSGETPPEVEADIVKDETLNSHQAKLEELESRIATAGGANNPASANLGRLRQQAQQRLDDRREFLRNVHINARKAELGAKMAEASASLESIEASTKLAGDKMAEITAAVESFKALQVNQDIYKKKMEEVSDELENITNRKLPSNFARVDWFSRPPKPETPSFPRLSIVMSAAIMLGLALSVGIAFLREITDTSVRSPRDIARVGQMNLLGMIPHESDDPQAIGARIPLVIFDAPHSMAAEEFRKLRTRLQHTASLDSTRSILISSANPGDGKTTIACNLAAGLALNGRRILLVDANFRRPDIHNLFEVSNEKGFSDSLNDITAFDTLVRDTPVQNLHVMPTGAKPVNATELLESQLLIDFIERALEDYDHVIFDSGPLLMASETMALAPRVDGVVTVVRARANSRGVLTRMRDMLRQVKAEHLGVVLNAVRSQGGGYYGRNIKNYYAYQNS